MTSKPMGIEELAMEFMDAYDDDANYNLKQTINFVKKLMNLHTKQGFDAQDIQLCIMSRCDLSKDEWAAEAAETIIKLTGDTNEND